MSGLSKVRTRHESESNLTRYLAKSGEGNPKELLITELPTLRAILQLGLHLQEEKIRMEGVDKRNYSVVDLSHEMAAAVLVPWVKANGRELSITKLIRRKLKSLTKILTRCMT